MGASSSPAVAGSATATGMSAGMQQFGLAASTYGAVSNVVNAFTSANASKDALAFQSEVADYNSRIAEIKTKYAKQSGQQQEVSSRLNTAAIKSNQRVALAAGNVELNSGTAARVQDTTDVMGEIDAENIQANAIKAAWGYSAEASNYRSQSAGYGAQAGQISAGTAGFSSLLGGATSVADRWYKAYGSKTPAADTSTSDYLANSWK